MNRKPTKSAVVMPDIVGDTWFNSPPLARDDLRGRIVLADFWTYSCINCLRTLPFLREWWARYRDEGFVLLGIHAPEFEFEKQVENVGRAVEELGVTWPVVLDNDYVNWHNFANHYWPAKYLSNSEGRIVYEHFGEGQYSRTERKIQELLRSEQGFESLPEVVTEPVKSCVKATPELYCGYTRGRLANSSGFVYEADADYMAPKKIPVDTIALEGRFKATREYVQSSEPGSTVLLAFSATEVNMVLDAPADEARIRVLLGDEVAPSDIAGADVGHAGQVAVTEPRMYNLLKADHPVEGVLAAQALEGTLRAYAFTFSGCL